MKARVFASIIAIICFLSGKASATDLKPVKITPADPKSNQVLISKSEFLYGDSALSTVVVQTVIKSLPLDIPTSSNQQEEDSVAD